MHKKLLAILYLCFFVICAIHITFGSKGLIEYFKIKKSLFSLCEVNEQIRKENSKLWGKIVLLRTDVKFIEKIAREERGFASKGEAVFVFQ